MLQPSYQKKDDSIVLTVFNVAVAAKGQLKRLVSDLQRSVGQVSTRLVRQLKRRDRRLAKLSRNCDVVTAVLHAASLKRREPLLLCLFCFPITLFSPCCGELQMQKLKVPSVEVLPLKPGVGQHIAIHATLIARGVFLAYFYPLSPFTCIFSKTSYQFFLC